VAAAPDDGVDVSLGVKKRRLMKIPEPEDDLWPGQEAVEGGGLLGIGVAGPEDGGVPGLPGLPAAAMLPAQTLTEERSHDSKSGVARDTQAALAASPAAMAAAAAPASPPPPAAAAAAGAEVGAASMGRSSRPAVRNLYSGAARVWVDALRGAVEAVLAGGQQAGSGRPPAPLLSAAKGRLVQLEGQAWYFPLRYMQPRSSEGQRRLYVAATLLQGLSTGAGAAGAYPITLVPLVPRPAATALRVHLQGQAVPQHVACELPCSEDWAAVADIPTNLCPTSGLVGTKAAFDALTPLTGWHMLWGYTMSAWLARVCLHSLVPYVMVNIT
jgi:hypothetical protein